MAAAANDRLSSVWVSAPDTLRSPELTCTRYCTEVDKPVARVLLVGPFAAERHNSYIPWVYLGPIPAPEGIEVLRYDYRGIGESSGVFKEMSFTDWSRGRSSACRVAKDQSPELPLVLHGLGMGAFLASRAFHAGLGEVLLLWSPPASANQALRRRSCVG